MDIIESEITTKEQVYQLDELQKLLEMKIEMVKQGDSAVSRIESVCRQADLLAQSIKQSGILNQPQYEKRREHLKKLYNLLQLGITAQIESTTFQLYQIRKVKKTIGTYFGNI
jgi:hypothetical protein